MKIMIITPGHLASNPRVLKEASTLASAGHEIIVIYGQSIPWLAEADSQLAERQWRVVTVPFGRGCAGTLKHGLQVIRSRVAAMLLRYLPERWLPVTYLAALASSPVTCDLIVAARSIPADLAIAHYIPALPAAAAAARQSGSRFAFDAEDFHTGDLPDARNYNHRRAVIQSLEKHYLPQAEYVTAAAPGIAEAYAEAYGVTPEVVLNTFSKTLAPVQPSDAGTGSEPSIYWFSQTIGPDRGLEAAINALALADTHPHLYLRGNVSQSFQTLLYHLAEEQGVADRLHFLPIAPAGDMVRLCLDYDVGLVGETGHTRNRRIALTNKQFTYLIAGLPSVLSDVPAHQRFAKEAAGAAFLYKVDDARSLAEVLDTLLGSPEQLRKARRAAWELGHSRFNWEHDQVKLQSLVSALDRDSI